MYVITEQKQADRWLARVRLETENGWRCFQAAGDSRIGALMALHYAMWRYRGTAYEVARRAVVMAAVRPSFSARRRRESPATAGRRRARGARASHRRTLNRSHRRVAWV